MYEDRDATPSELSFFLANPNVGGYASFQDKRIVHNPFNNFTPEQRNGIRINEGTRLFLNDYPVLQPRYNLTPYQEIVLRNYGNNIQDKRNTIAGRYFSNDRSIGIPSSEQVNELNNLRRIMRMLGY